MKTIRVAPYVIACRMQLASKMLTYPAKLAFSAYLFFGGKSFLIFPMNDLRAKLANLLACVSQLCQKLITRLLSAPLVQRIGDWLCVLPAIINVVDKSQKVNKAASSDW